MNFWHQLFAVKPKGELKEFFLFTCLFSFASALILIFEPVFFYQQGFSLAKISIYYCLHYILYLFLLPLGGKFAYRFGLERSLSLAMPMFVVYFLMLAALPRAPELFWMAWVLLTVFKILYWPAAHAIIVRYGDRKNQGTELSWFFGLTYGVGIMGPLLGGIVATWFGFPVLFVIAAVTALFASFPLMKTRERYRPQDFPYAEAWRMMRAQKFRRLGWSMGGWIENLVDLVYWPIFMFIILGGADKLGFISSFNVFLMALLGFIIGEVSDRLPSRRILRLHLPFMFIGYLMRPIIFSPISVLLTDALGRAAYIGVRLPMWHFLYPRAKREGPLRYMVMIEMQLAVAKAVAAGGLAMVFWISSVYTGFIVAYLLAALTTILYIFM